MKWGIVANFGKKNIRHLMEDIVRWGRKEGVQFVIYESEQQDILNKIQGIIYRQGNNIDKDISVVLSVGGDGTFLRAARLVGKARKPIAGINIGKMGFLTEINAKNTIEALNRIKNKKYKIEKRLVLQSMFHNDSVFALNDIVISSGSSPRIMKMECYLNNEYLTTIEADGVIVSSPTGSTAYSLSAGGPILTPEIEAFVIAPICPHTLGLRPIVIPSSYTVKIVLKNMGGMIIADGQGSLNMEKNESVIIRKANHYVSIIKFPELSFYKTLREKLHWGGLKDKRGRK